MKDLSGLAAIITGGASGLGGATSEMLAARGMKVTIFDDVNGGAIAPGHPLGASSAKLMATLLHNCVRAANATNCKPCAKPAASPMS